MKMLKISSIIIPLLASISACDTQINSAENQNKANKKSTIVEPQSLTKNTTSEIKFEKFILENGLEVVFHIDRSDPVVAVALTSHVGSARETEGRTGFAHLFEHLLFLESENLGKGGLDKMSARIGGSGANGSTSRDRTNYFQTVPNNALEKMIWAEADKLGFFINTVTEQVLAKEKQVVKNEKRQSNDNRPYGHTQYVIDKNLYPEGHPYSWQIIGSLTDLQSATLQDVKDFFNRWYVPNNVTLVISGDFDEQQAKAWVHKYFDEIKAGDKIEPLAKPKITLAKTKKLYHEDNFAQLPELTLTWPTVEQYHEDSFALDMLATLLSDGKKATLNKTLIDDLQLAPAVNIFNYQSELAGQLMLRVQAFDGISLDKVEQAIYKAFEKFEQESFTEEDLNTIKAGQERKFYQGLSSVLGKGFLLAQYNIFRGDPDFINQDVDKILKVTKADIIRVYNTYIKNKHFVATSFVPKGQSQLALSDSNKAEVVEEKIVANAEQSFDASTQATYERSPSTFDRSVEPPYGESPKLKVPDVWSLNSKNKTTTLGIKNTEVPLVQLTIDIAGGLLFEEENKIGVTNLVAELLNKGTKNKTPLELEEAINKLGANIKVYATPESIRINASALTRNHAEVIALVTEMLLHPRWDESEFALVKSDVISQIQQAATSPRQIANDQFNHLLFNEESILANNLLGTEQSVEMITLADLKSYFQQKVKPQFANIHVVGDVDKAQIQSAFAELEENWQATALQLPIVKQPTLAEKSKIYFYDVPGAKQSQVRIGFPSLKASDQNFFAAHVMNYKLGGGSFASKLTQELRESKGYTYGVFSSFNGSNNQGDFKISSGVRTNVTLEAVALIKELTEQYGEKFNEKNLATTKSYFLKSNARKFETFDAKLNILENMSAHDLPANYVLQRAESVENLTLPKIKSLAAKYLKTEQMIYLIVGDAETQLSRLSALGLGDAVLLNPAKTE